MLSRQCIEDISKYTIEYWQEEYSEELRERYKELEEERLSLLTDKELDKELRQLWKDIDYRVEVVDGDISMRYRKAKMVDMKEYTREEKIEWLMIYLDYYRDDFTDWLVEVYIGD